MSSKSDSVMQKLKGFDKDKALVELMEVMKKVDVKSVNAKLNEESFVDNEGNRIFYWLTEDTIHNRNVSRGDRLNSEVNTNNRTEGMLKRFLNVAYVILILMSVFVARFAWLVNKPVVNKNYSYLVSCNNGKTFDPASKPIDSIFNGSNEPLTFDNNQLKSECEYNTAYFVGLSSKLQANYKITNTASVSKVGSLRSQVTLTVFWLIGYLLAIEIISRTFLYIIYGQKFFKGIKK